MDCTKHFLNFHWEHHVWRRRVSAAERMWSSETDMWGRPVTGDYVRCVTEYVCDVCGKVRTDGFCHCDVARGDACAIRRAFLDGSRPAR